MTFESGLGLCRFRWIVPVARYGDGSVFQCVFHIQTAAPVKADAAVCMLYEDEKGSVKRSMKDKELLYIKTIAEEKNITRAAQKLHVAQPSLTQCVQRIEKELNCPLFYRQKSGLVLTDAGALYYKVACDILKLWEHFSQAIEDMQQVTSGSLSIGASWYNTLLILTSFLPVYTKKYPQVEVRLQEKNSTELERLLSQGELDLILTHEYPEELNVKQNFESKRLVHVPLLREDFCVVVAQQYPLTGEKPVGDDDLPLLSLSELASVPYVQFNHNQRIRHISNFALEQAGIHPPVAVSTYGFPSAFELVSRGMGFTFLPEHYVRRFAPNRQAVQVFKIAGEHSAYWTTSVCYYQSDYMPVTVERFLELMRSQRFPYA